jgi:hypothetical protein
MKELLSDEGAETSKVEKPSPANEIKGPYLGFLGAADCYIHDIIDEEALEIAEVEGLKAGQLFFEKCKTLKVVHSNSTTKILETS